METQRGTATAALGTTPAERRDPAARRRLSGPGLRAFFNVTRAWQLTVDEERGLLGWPPPSTFHKYKSGNGGVLGLDALTRISLVLGIYKSLHILYPDAALADRWMRMPNSNPLFGGRRAGGGAAAGRRCPRRR